MCWNNCKRVYYENNQKSGRMGIGSCTMTMPLPTQPSASSSFWLKTKWSLCPTFLLTQSRLLWLFYTHRWSRIWNRGVLLMSQRFNENHWWPLTAFPLKILDSVSSIGSRAGFAASSRRGCTSNGTKVSNLHKYFKWIFLTIPEIFGSLHIFNW